jgi:hypothetical protein
MRYSLKRILSGLTAGVCLVWAIFAGGIPAVVPVTVLDAIALILIWNSDDLSSSTLASFTTSPTPAWILSLGGWIVMSLPVIFLWRVCFH